MFKEMKDIIDQDVYFAEKMHNKDKIYKLKTKSKGLFKEGKLPAFWSFKGKVVEEISEVDQM